MVKPKGPPIIQIGLEQPTYLVNCSNCGSIARQLNSREAQELRTNHRCNDNNSFVEEPADHVAQRYNVFDQER